MKKLLIILLLGCSEVELEKVYETETIYLNIPIESGEYKYINLNGWDVYTLRPDWERLERLTSIEDPQDKILVYGGIVASYLKATVNRESDKGIVFYPYHYNDSNLRGVSDDYVWHHENGHHLHYYNRTYAKDSIILKAYKDSDRSRDNAFEWFADQYANYKTGKDYHEIIKRILLKDRKAEV